MNVGDYVRTKNNGIRKILDIGEYLGMKQYLIDEDGTYVIDNSIIKSAEGTLEGLLSLIEVGDVLSFEDESVCRVIEIEDNGYYLLRDYGGDQYYESKIWISNFNSIVTKEQFESVEYKVGK